MTIEELKKKMETGIVEFSYRKVSTGEVRQAKGTLCSKYFTYESKGGRKPSEDVVVYWDLDRASFRSFRRDQFIG